VLLGSVTANEAHVKALEHTTRVFGQHVAPDDAYLALRGMRTLGVRLRQHQDNALAIAHWLKAQPQVAKVLHPALPDCPGHDIWARDFKGSSGLFSFVLKGGNDAARAALIDGLAHFGIGFSWGGYESLILPIDPQPLRSATHREEEGPMVRLQIGLEDPDDLIADLAEGLRRFEAAM
jgi:cystathionine beta-lyase